MTTRTTSEGFIVVEMDSAGKPTMRMWITRSDVDAAFVALTLGKMPWAKDFNFHVRHANVMEFETK